MEVKQNELLFMTCITGNYTKDKICLIVVNIMQLPDSMKKYMHLAVCQLMKSWTRLSSFFSKKISGITHQICHFTYKVRLQ